MAYKARSRKQGTQFYDVTIRRPALRKSTSTIASHQRDTSIFTNLAERQFSQVKSPVVMPIVLSVEDVGHKRQGPRDRSAQVRV